MREFNPRKPMTALLTLAALSGCAAPGNTKLYTGSALPPADIAVIHNNPMIRGITDSGATLNSVDGKKLSILSSAVEVLPGTHNLDVQCSFSVRLDLLGTNIDPLYFGVRKTIIKQDSAALTVNTEPGHDYRIDAVFQRDQSCKAVLTDITADAK